MTNPQKRPSAQVTEWGQRLRQTADAAGDELAKFRRELHELGELPPNWYTTSVTLGIARDTLYVLDYALADWVPRTGDWPPEPYKEIPDLPY